MGGLKRRPQCSFPFRALLVSRFESRKLLILMVVVITTITIDSQIGYIADFIPEQVSSDAGVAAFILMAVIFAVSQYFILGYVKQTNKENRARALHLGLTHSIVSIAQFVLVGILAFVIVQIPSWNMKADYVETCNCEYGCPCNFSGFPTYGAVGLYYYFILDLEVTAIPSLMMSILSLHNHGQKLSMKVMVLFCYSLQIKRMKNKEGQLYRLFLDRQRGIVLHYLQVRLAVFLNHNLLISMPR
jgi:hypothetical protein